MVEAQCSVQLCFPIELNDDNMMEDVHLVGFMSKLLETKIVQVLRFKLGQVFLIVMGHGKKPIARQVVKKLIADGGMAGFYRGLGPRFFSVSAWGTSMILAYEYLIKDPSIKVLAEQIAKDPSFNQMAEQLHKTFHGATVDNGIPNFDTEQYYTTMQKVMQNPQFMTMDEKLGTAMMQVPSKSTMYQASVRSAHLPRPKNCDCVLRRARKHIKGRGS